MAPATVGGVRQAEHGAAVVEASPITIETMADEVLFLRCGVCGTEFRSEFEVDRASIDVFAGNELQCPKCEAQVGLSAETMIFKA